MAPTPLIDLEKSSRGLAGRATKLRRRLQARSYLGLLALLVLMGGSGLLWRNGTSSSAARAPPRADVVFVIDATGSMGDEIEDVKEGLMSIGNLLANKKPQPDIRFGVVFYRDISDKDLVQSAHLSHDLASVRDRIMGVHAIGGGDWEEHVGAGLHRALEMDWSHSEEGGTRLIYLVGDAPPQEYDDGYGVPAALELAKDMGVKIHVIGCSGLGSGAPAMERIAAATGGNFSVLERRAGGQGGPSRRPSSGPRTSASRPSSRREEDLGRAIAIDLGTTHLRVGAYWHGRPEVIPNSLGEYSTPAYLAFTGDGHFLGEDARKHAETGTVLSLHGIKRLAGLRFDSPLAKREMELLPFDFVEQNETVAMRVTVDGGVRVVSVEEALSMMILQMKRIAEAHLGSDVRTAVVTVPAASSDAQRKGISDAVRRAGFRSVRLLTEPEAAALEYRTPASEKTVLVCDFDGDALSVTLVDVDGDRADTMDSSRVTGFGGENFTQRLLGHFGKLFEKKHGRDLPRQGRPMRRLRRAVEEAKAALSQAASSTVMIDDLYDGLDFSGSVSRAFFEELSKDLFEQALGQLQRALDGLGGLPRVDAVLLLGGPTRMPRLRQLLQDFFRGRASEVVSGSPEQAVRGATRHAHPLTRGEGGSDLLLLDVTPLTIGLETAGGVMSPLIKRNAVIPTRTALTLSTSTDDQDTIAVRLFEGERLMAKDSHLLGEFNITGIPPAAQGQPKVALMLEVDSDGIIRLFRDDDPTGTALWTSSSDRGLTEEQIEDMIRDAEASADGDARERSRLGGMTVAERCAGADRSSPVLDAAVDVEDDEGPGAALDAEDEAGEAEMGRLSRNLYDSLYDEL